MVKLKLNVLFILILIATNNLCEAQLLKPYKIVDRHCKDCSEMTYGSMGFELKDISQSDEEIEIRFLVNGEHISRSFTVIKGAKEKLTAAYYFQYFDNFRSMTNPDSAKGLKHWEPYPFKRFEVKGFDLDSIVDKLVANKIYELPNQNVLVPNAGYYRQYGVETKLKGVVRRYYFGNLNEFMLNYPDIPEFKSYIKIVRIFKEISLDYMTTLKALESQ